MNERSSYDRINNITNLAAETSLHFLSSVVVVFLAGFD